MNMDINIKRIEINRFGRFTIASAVSDEEKVVGVGISRCSELDGFNPILGEQIAEGRARKAVKNRLAKVRQQCPLMG